MEHDDRCNQQDRELTMLKEQFRQAVKDLDTVADRIEKLVTQYHEQNVTIARMDATLTTGVSDIHDIKGILKDKVAGREEFLIVRNQLWAGIGIVIMGVLSAIVTWVVKGGLVRSQ